MSVTMNKYIPDLSKFEPLDGTIYRHWSQRTIIFFEQLEVNYILFNPPVAKELSDSATVIKDSDADATTKAKFDKDNRMVRGHMLSYMANNLFDLFVKNKSTKSIWDTLEKKLHACKKLVFDILVEGMKMYGILQTNILIEKLPKSWSDYCNLLKHKKRDISLEELISHMKIEEVNCLKDKALVTSSEFRLKANLMESGFVNLVENNVEWIVDVGASKHFWANREMFTEFENAAEGEQVYMDIKLVLESDKLVPSRNGDYVGKGYLGGGLFVIETMFNNNNKSTTSAYIVESIDM
ncbi:ty1-copia retrotransposon protein [Gossypium australe]|uniref:Ty1-copia retrotransposon protein n=1 Tax=Gossypium australe TaxID=47621 RepID=A0A5B6WPG7_9ROSI|nr:ty1-copia retrotransposon protein [Gossypium australe]